MMVYRLLLLFPVCFPAVLHPQVTVGHRAGLTLSHWAVSGGSSSLASQWDGDQSLLPGFFFEVPVEVPVGNRLKLSSGLGFIQKGAQMDDGDERYRMTYLQAPVSVGLNMSMGHFLLSPGFGAAFAYNMRGTYSMPLTPDGDRFSSPIGRPDDHGFFFRMPLIEWSLLGRFSCAYRLKRSTVVCDLGYQHGLSNVMIEGIDEYSNYFYPEGVSEPVSPPRALQRTWTISIGYSLLLARKDRSSDDTTAVAQEPRSARFLIGQRLGLSSTSMRFSAALAEEQQRVEEGAEPLIGVSTAVTVLIPLGQHFSLQPELAFTQRGWRCQWQPRPSYKNDILRMNYAELPLLARYSSRSGKFRPFALVGGVPAVGVGGYDLVRRDVLGNGQEFAFQWPVSFGSEPEQGDYARFDFALLIGGGLSWKREQSEFFLDVRYQYSVTDLVADTTPLLYSDEVDAHHRVWLLNVGYLLPW
ncbi:MAG: outer membrane beta-barrel protein [Flavobacteriales bacterium]